MTHFGFAFGVITASVLGGAFVIDHHLKSSPDTTTRTTATTTVAEAPAMPPADDATKLADASAATQPRIESPVTMPEPSKAAKAPARSVTSRSSTPPSPPEVLSSPPAEVTPSTSEVPSATPSPEPAEKAEPQPAPAKSPEG